jgi:tripartite-type tricarboxylate transporter receptor subunit TctC
MSNLKLLRRRQFLHLAAGAAALPMVPHIARAQAYPTRPITIVVPFPAGGPTDTLARILGERIRKSLGQTIVVENVSGAGGSIGAGRVARATPDGYTISIGHWQTHVVNGATYPLGYDVVKDFEPVLLLADCPMWLVARTSFPPKDLRALVTWLKENPGKATVGTVGVGGGGDIVGTYFQKNTGTQFQFVPYRGGAPMIQDLVAGQIDMIFTQVATALAQARANQVKAYAVMAKTRWGATPDTPTIDEAGVSGLYASYWHGLWFPKATPKEVVAKFHAAVIEALADPVVQRRFAELGQQIWPREQQTPEALVALQKAEVEKWWPIIKASGIKGE